MKFWPFPLIRIRETNKELTAIFLLFSQSDTLKVIKQSQHETTVSSEHGLLHFWSANAYYAWAQCGWYEPTCGKRVAWFGEMPSRYAVRAMAKAINWKKPVKQKFKLEGV